MTYLKSDTKKITGDILMLILISIVFSSSFIIATNAEALELKLLWKKDFQSQIDSVDLAKETGDVILSLSKREIILYDKNGNEKFHWGPRVDRYVGGVQISQDAKYFAFYSGYTAEYAKEKKLSGWKDDRIHFYNSKTKEELWNIISLESGPLIYPDGSLLINQWFNGGFEIVNSEGKVVFEYKDKKFSISSFIISSDSNYFAVVGDLKQPLMLFKKDGTKLWETGRHSKIASISNGASYISTYPYLLGRSYIADQQNSHKGIVYDRNGNKVLEGFGILSGNGAKVAMYSSDKITIISLPDKAVLKEIPIKVNLPKVSDPFFAIFSYDGRYLVVRSENSIIVYDLIEDIKKEIEVSELGKWRYGWLTNDGKYLVLRSDKKIIFYQLY